MRRKMESRPLARPALSMRHVSMTFPGTRALDSVTIDVDPGEIRALVGPNGSGKSTLVKILAGYHRPDPGSFVSLSGEEFDLGSRAPHTARPAQDRLNDLVRIVHQDLGLVLELSALDNIGLRGGFVTGRFGRLRWRDQRKLARNLMRRFELDLDLDLAISEATAVERTILAIAAALEKPLGKGGVLVLDEPTAALPPTEVGRLFDVVRQVKAEGTSVIYVSHRMDEIFNLAETVTVLRGGEVVATRETSSLSRSSLTELMCGEVNYPDREVTAMAEDMPEVLIAEDLRGRSVSGVSLTVRRGEVVGIVGLPGSGREELPYLIAGLTDYPVSGRIVIRAASVSSSTVRVPLVPADRSHEGLVGDFTVKENFTLSVLSRFKNALGVLTAQKEEHCVKQGIRDYAVHCPGPDAKVGTLSGGNQQKVLVGRCLQEGAPLLVLNEPTAGVDVGSRQILYELLLKEVREGVAIVVASTDAEDLLALCDRVLVMNNGSIARELHRHEITETSLLHAMQEDTRAVIEELT